MTEILILLNPKAGTESFDDIFYKVSRWSAKITACKFNIKIIENYEQTREYVRMAIEKGIYAVVVVGGDGTVSSVAELLKGSKTAMGIIPTGSGNGVANHLGIPLETEKALDTILSSKVKNVDTIDVNGNFCLGITGIGFEAHIAEQFTSSEKRGFITYSKLALTEFFKYVPREYKIDIDGVESVHTPFTMSFANVSQWGNDFKIAPGASMTSGKIQIVELTNVNELNVMPTVYELYTGRIDKLSWCNVQEAEKVIITGEDIAYHIDGDAMPRTDRIEISIDPKSLKILSPSKNI